MAKEDKKPKVNAVKKAAVARFVDLAGKRNTMMIISVEGISSLNFQQIKKALKPESEMAVTKKSIMFRTIETLKKTNPDAALLEKWIEKPSFAAVFSNLDPFELSILLGNYSFPAKIKAGQISPKDIIVEAGATDIPAGPMIAEIAAVGIKAGLVGGKIEIKERKVLVKEGDKIPANIAAILPKMEICPFRVGPIAFAAYDRKNGKVYENIKVDKEATLNMLKLFASEAFSLSMHIAYPTAETISMLLGRANSELNSLSNLIK
ncbi:MAG: 50S ribosomal protein L10 [Candidatus Paceibacterota bacterium]